MSQSNTVELKINRQNLEIFTYWINERHRIYIKKTAGEPKPWSDDPIFQNYKFDNVFRYLDKQSQWLIQHVIKPHKEDDPAILLFNIFVFRAFNWSPTYAEILTQLYNAGFKENAWIDYWEEENIKNVLEPISLDPTRQLTSGAYMIRGYKDKPKWESIPETLTQIWERKNALTEYIQKWHLLQTTTEAFINQRFWGWGPFTCYQVALDLTYTTILENPRDINTWCEFGPGAIRGLTAIFPDIKKKDYLNAAKWLLKNVVTEEHVTQLNLQDIEFCLCELQKYLRIKEGMGGVAKYNGTT